MYSVTAWGWYWLGCLALILAPELYWVFVNARNTISENVWALERLNAAHPFDMAIWTPAHWVIALALWTLFGWLSVHLTFGLLS
jgi:hypothetical protein